MGKTFLLGVGAQKAGTTWLHHYINCRHDSDMGFCKEYHIFDALTVPSCSKFRKQVEEQILDVTSKGFNEWKDNPAVKRFCFMSDTRSYFSYFSDILNRPEVKITGDITPTYCALSVETLAYIKSEFEMRDITVRPVFIMRDPVTRLNSMTRMGFRKNDSPSYQMEISAMRKLCHSNEDDTRSNYIMTLNNLEEVFGDNTCLVFYENLFCDETVGEICEFLELDFIGGNYENYENPSPKGNELKKSDISYFANEYRDYYDHCVQKFGRSKIDEIWKSFRD